MFGYDTFVENIIVESTSVEGKLVEWNIGRTEHCSNGTLVQRNVRRMFRSTNFPLDECSVDESAFDEIAFDESVFDKSVVSRIAVRTTPMLKDFYF